MKKKHYIGKKLSECPDGTMAVASAGRCMYVVVIKGGEVFHVLANGELEGQGTYSAFDYSASDYTVHHIIKLGKPRPKTFADEGELEVWQEPDGWLAWRSQHLVMKAEPRNGIALQSFTDATLSPIESDYTHLGKLEGLLIGGRVVKFGGEGDD